MSGMRSECELKREANYLQDNRVRSFSMIRIKQDTISLLLLLVVNSVKMVFQALTLQYYS